MYVDAAPLVDLLKYVDLPTRGAPVGTDNGRLNMLSRLTPFN